MTHCRTCRCRLHRPRRKSAGGHWHGSCCLRLTLRTTYKVSSGSQFRCDPLRASPIKIEQTHKDAQFSIRIDTFSDGHGTACSSCCSSMGPGQCFMFLGSSNNMLIYISIYDRSVEELTTLATLHVQPGRFAHARMTIIPSVSLVLLPVLLLRVYHPLPANLRHLLLVRLLRLHLRQQVSLAFPDRSSYWTEARSLLLG